MATYNTGLPCLEESINDNLVYPLGNNLLVRVTPTRSVVEWVSPFYTDPRRRAQDGDEAYSERCQIARQAFDEECVASAQESVNRISDGLKVLLETFTAPTEHAARLGKEAYALFVGNATKESHVTSVVERRLTPALDFVFSCEDHLSGVHDLMSDDDQKKVILTLKTDYKHTAAYATDVVKTVAVQVWLLREAYTIRSVQSGFMAIEDRSSTTGGKRKVTGMQYADSTSFPEPCSVLAAVALRLEKSDKLPRDFANFTMSWLTSPHALICLLYLTSKKEHRVGLPSISGDSTSRPRILAWIANYYERVFYPALEALAVDFNVTVPKKNSHKMIHLRNAMYTWLVGVHQITYNWGLPRIQSPQDPDYDHYLILFGQISYAFEGIFIHFADPDKNKGKIKEWIDNPVPLLQGDLRTSWPFWLVESYCVRRGFTPPSLDKLYLSTH